MQMNREEQLNHELQLFVNQNIVNTDIYDVDGVSDPLGIFILDLLNT